MGRRAFLKKSLVGTLVLSSSSLFLTSCASYNAPETELLALSPKEFACLNGVCDALIPFDSENLPRPSEIGTVHAVDKLLLTLPDENKKQMKLLFRAFEHSRNRRLKNKERFFRLLKTARFPLRALRLRG